MEALLGQLEELKIAKIRYPERELRSEIGSLDELAASIDRNGLLQPIVVRAVLGWFEVVAGNRRFAACKRLGWNKIPCHIIELDDKEAYEVALIENLQRRTMNPVEEAEAFRKYVDEFGYGGVSELAKRIGKSEPYVSKRIALLDLPKEVQDQLIRRRISAGIAEECLGLDESELITATELIEQGATRNELRGRIKNLRRSKAMSPAVQQGCTDDELSIRRVDVALRRCVTSLKICLMKFDEALDYLGEDHWIARQVLAERRMAIHREVDSLIRLRRRARLLSGALPPAVGYSRGTNKGHSHKRMRTNEAIQNLFG